MPGFNDGWLGVPARPGKPRQVGLTHVIDKGLNTRDIEGMFDTGGDFVDIVKLGWGTSYVTNNLEKKIALYRHFGLRGDGSPIRVWPSGQTRPLKCTTKSGSDQRSDPWV